MKTTILTNRSGSHQSIEEEKVSWIHSLLSFLGLDQKTLNRQDRPDLVDDYLRKESIEIIDYPSLGAVKVLYGGELVGEWLGAVSHILKQDAKNESYYEVIIEHWSVMEEDEKK